jgi:hypothetical protein
MKKVNKRCRVERLSKFITWVSVVLVLTVGNIFGWSGYIVAIISSTLWFVVPDITAYILEAVYHLKHKTDVYR